MGLRTAGSEYQLVIKLASTLKTIDVLFEEDSGCFRCLIKFVNLSEVVAVARGWGLWERLDDFYQPCMLDDKKRIFN